MARYTATSRQPSAMGGASSAVLAQLEVPIEHNSAAGAEELRRPCRARRADDLHRDRHRQMLRLALRELRPGHADRGYPDHLAGIGR